MRIRPRALWGAAAVVLLALGVLAVGVWSGGCRDYAGIPGECWAEPSLGWPGAVLAAVVCASAAALCIWRATRSTPRRPGS